MAAVTAALALLPCSAGYALDLTTLSLQELMNVEAGNSSSRFVVSAVAVESCSVAASDHQFGSYDPLRALPTDSSSAVTVTCTVDSALSGS